MKNTGTLTVARKSDNEIVMTRVFDAPKHLVYDCLTKPELLKRWFGPHGHNLVVCEIDLRVGGKWRFVIRDPQGNDMGMFGEWKELGYPDRIVHTESFDQFPGAPAVITTSLTESGGKTTLTATIAYENKEVGDAVIASGMEHGAAESYDRMAALLPTLM
jgi:uncharacterized protein YndB with AHSA1/START domain